PDRDLPRHPGARFRARSGAAQGPGDQDRSPRARSPPRVGRKGRTRHGPLTRRRDHPDPGDHMPEAVIVDAIRTPVGRAVKGSLKTVRADELAALPIRTLVERNPDVDFSETNDVLMGA